MIPPGRIKNIAYELMTTDQRQEFEKKPEMNLAITEEGIGRFRVNIYKQRNDISMVIRYIKTKIPDIESLGLPEILKKLVKAQRGLILFVGATGTGKSTSLAALVDHRNQFMDGHIITIEEPIEYIHQHKMSLISQREIGIDTDNYEDALHNTLRQAPDVILIGEIRTSKAMEYALTFSETGHLVLSTLHGSSATGAIDRIINFFHEERRDQILSDLANNLCAIVSQRLLPAKDGKSLCAIFEVLINTPRVSDLILKSEVELLVEAMEKGEEIGMQTFDSSIIKLYQKGKITYDEAIRNANSENNVRLKIKLADNGNVKAGTGGNLKMHRD
jgi:twitching motility protein PilU